MSFSTLFNKVVSSVEIVSAEFSQPTTHINNRTYALKPGDGSDFKSWAALLSDGTVKEVVLAKRGFTAHDVVRLCSFAGYECGTDDAHKFMAYALLVANKFKTPIFLCDRGSVVTVRCIGQVELGLPRYNESFGLVVPPSVFEEEDLVPPVDVEIPIPDAVVETTIDEDVTPSTDEGTGVVGDSSDATGEIIPQDSGSENTDPPINVIDTAVGTDATSQDSIHTGNLEAVAMDVTAPSPDTNESVVSDGDAGDQDKTGDNTDSVAAEEEKPAVPKRKTTRKRKPTKKSTSTKPAEKDSEKE